MFSDEKIIGLELGVLGSYVSIWSRFGKMNMTGLASKNIHYFCNYNFKNRLTCLRLKYIVNAEMLYANQ